MEQISDGQASSAQGEQSARCHVSGSTSSAVTGATSTEELSVEDSCQNARGRCCGPAAPQRTLASAWEALQTGSASVTHRIMKDTKSMAANEQSQNVQPRSSSQEASLHTTVARLTARVNRSISSYASRRKPRDSSSSSSSRCAAQQEQHANERDRHDTASGEVGDTPRRGRGTRRRRSMRCTHG